MNFKDFTKLKQRSSISPSAYHKASGHKASGGLDNDNDNDNTFLKVDDNDDRDEATIRMESFVTITKSLQFFNYFN